MSADGFEGLEKAAFHIRHDILKMCVKAKTGHVTSSMSCVDLLVALYHGGILRHDPANPEWEDRDVFILSKGQASPALYVVLASRGYFPKKELDRFAQKDGMFGVHLQKSVPGAELTCGSLGQGFNLAVGMALANKMDRRLPLVFAMLGDGECYEGSIWEGAMFAAHNRLNNLVAIVDRNHMCVTDFTENMLGLESMAAKWESFGWDVMEIDGHSYEEIFEALGEARRRVSPRPLAIIADTEKGCGIELMSNVPLWHGMAPAGAVSEKAMESLKSLCLHCRNCERKDI